MLSFTSISETAISSLPDNSGTALEIFGTVYGNMTAIAKLRIVVEFGERPVVAAEITLANLTA